MKNCFEIYLTKKHVTKEEWIELIKTISNYNGFFRIWTIMIIKTKNKIRYFIKSRCSLPTTINNLNSFLIRPINNKLVAKYDYTSFMFPKVGSSVVDIINYGEIGKNGEFKCLEITFFKLYKNKIKSNIEVYLQKKNITKRYKLIYAIPEKILSIDFEGNKRYFYNNAPKYLDISKILHLLNTDKNNALLEIDTFPYLQGNFYLNQSNFSFDKHSIIMGSSVCGKSKFISSMSNNINKNKNIKQKYKVVIIDPHAALEDDIGGIARVIDFKSKHDSIDLFINNSDDIVASDELLLSLFKTLIADQYNSKLERVLRHSIYLLLTAETFNFRCLRKLLLDLEYRNYLIKKLKGDLPDSVIEFFLSDFNNLKTKSYSEAISPIIGFIDEMEMIPVFNREDISENLKDTIHDNFLSIFSLDRTKLGDKVTKTIAGLIMQQLLTIMQQQEIDEHIIFIIDEVAVVENPILARFLSEARKYDLSLILAGQYFSQITEGLKNSIFANVINYFIFRVSKLDATTLANNFNMKIPLDDTHDRKIKLLSELNNRECIARVDVNGVLLPAFKAKTLEYTSIPRKKRKIEIKKELNKNNGDNNKKRFSLDSNVNLKDILISNSTSRKVVKK